MWDVGEKMLFMPLMARRICNPFKGGVWGMTQPLKCNRRSRHFCGNAIGRSVRHEIPIRIKVKIFLPLWVI